MMEDARKDELKEAIKHIYSEDFYEDFVPKLSKRDEKYKAEYKAKFKAFYEFAESIVTLISDGNFQQALSEVESAKNNYSDEKKIIFYHFINFQNHVKYCCNESEKSYNYNLYMPYDPMMYWNLEQYRYNVDCDLRDNFYDNFYDFPAYPYSVSRFMISNYADFVYRTEGLKATLSELKRYRKQFFLFYEDEDETILECSLYSQEGNIEKLYEKLLVLKDIHKQRDSSETGALLLRLADCEYRLGMFEKSIETAKEAYFYGCWIFGYANQVVESYIALKQYDKAREFVDRIEATFRDKLKKTEKTESYEIHSLDIPFYFRDRIDSAEKIKKITVYLLWIMTTLSKNV